MSGDPNNTRITAITVGDAIVDGMSSRVFWGPTTVTYAFPDVATDYDIPNYHALSPLDELNSFAAASAAQQSAALAIMSDIVDFTNVSFVAGSDTNANMRIGTSGVGSATLQGWTYHAFPTEITGGDVWIKSGSPAPVVGTAAHLVLNHEIGHSMGLDHPWAGTHGTSHIWATMGAQYDGFEYTVMSYSGYNKPNGEYGAWAEVGANSFAQTFMMHDIYTLQYMYGADYTTNAGNNVYSWSSGSGDTLNNGSIMVDPTANKIFATIWDGGGVDTYDLSAYTTALQIDLSPGKSSAFSTSQLANLGDGVNAQGNIYNALMFGGNTASLIENAIGGTGADTISGNSAANTLTGGGAADVLEGGLGNDTLIGNAGLDVLNGGQGNDTLTGGTGASNQDTFLFKTTTIGQDVVTDWQDGIDYIRFQSAALTSFAQVQANATQVGANVVIDMPNNSDTITVQGWTLAQMNAGDFLFS
jgi:serralysin